MKKEDMIRQILREIESDFAVALRLGKIDSKQFNQAVKTEWSHLREKCYTEIEQLYYSAAA